MRLVTLALTLVLAVAAVACWMTAIWTTGELSLRMGSTGALAFASSLVALTAWIYQGRDRR